MDQSLSAYGTFVGKYFDQAAITKSIHGIEDALVSGDFLLENAVNEYTGFEVQNQGENFPSCERVVPALVTHSTPAEVAIKPFAFPIVIKHPADYTKRVLVVGDGRPFMKPDHKNGMGSKVVNTMEMMLLGTMMKLTGRWVAGEKSRLLDLGFVQQQVFSRWVSDGVSNWFELDLDQRQKLKILAAFYYQCLFHDAENFGEIARNLMVQTAFKAAGVNNFDHRIHFEDIEHIPTFEAFIAEAKRILDTPRVDALNIGVWTKIIGGTWFGFNGREIANAALEHPPTFLAMLYVSFAQNGYRKAGLSRISENYKGPKGGLEFVRSVQLM